jgi:hypothetical protein
VDLAARISRGEAFPDGAPSRLGTTILLSAEDDAATVVCPRLIGQGADLDRVIVPREFNTLVLPDNTSQLERMILKLGPEVRLLVIDPVTSFLRGIDIYKDDSVRSLYRPLVALARKCHIAVVLVVHFGKDGEMKAKYRTLGSVAFVNAARASFAIGREFEEDPVAHFLNTKMNYGKTGLAGLKYRIREEAGAPRLVWEEAPSPLCAESLGKGSRDARMAKVLEWIEGFCAKGDVSYVTDANLQQSGLPGTKGDPDYCRELLWLLESAGKGRIEKTGRKLLKFLPGGKPGT